MCSAGPSTHFNFTEMRLQHRCFPVNIAKFLRTPILKNISEWLLLGYLSSSTSSSFYLKVTSLVWKISFVVVKDGLDISTIELWVLLNPLVPGAPGVVGHAYLNKPTTERRCRLILSAFPYNTLVWLCKVQL